MNFKFAKTLLVSSALTMGAFGLVACGGENPSGPSNGGTKIEVPKENDASISFTKMTANKSGDNMRFSGSVTLDQKDTNVTENTSLEFDSVQVMVVKKTDLNKALPVKPIVGNPFVGPAETISLQSLNIAVNLKDPDFKECGSFALAVNVFGTFIDETGKSHKKRAIDYIDFERPQATYCKEEQQHEQPIAQEIEMISYTATISTTDGVGLDLATGKAGNDIVAVKAADGSEDVDITSATGAKFSPITNADEDATGCTWYNTSFWPELASTIGFTADKCPTAVTKTQAFVSDFKYRSIDGAGIEHLISDNDGKIFVVKTSSYNAATGAGFYAFGVSERKRENNNNFTLTLKVYKIK